MLEPPRVPQLSELNVQTGVVFGVAVVASIAAVRFEAFERFCSIARQFEYMQVDELIVVALVLCIAFIYLFIARDLQVRRYIREVEIQRLRALRAAFEDELTGLPNRRALTERLEGVRCRTGAGVTVLMLDLDGFKSVNDRHGHDMGDEVLRCVAARLRKLAEGWPGMLMARLGGDEFSCVIDSVPSTTAVSELAIAIVQDVTAPIPGCPDAMIGVSIGIASKVGQAHTTALLQRADEAMYRAKRAGGSCFRVAQPLHDATTSLASHPKCAHKVACQSG